MAAHAVTGRQIRRDASLTVRMLLVMVLTPLFALGALVALFFVLSTGLLIGVVIALSIGVAVAVQRGEKARRETQGRELGDAEDPQLMAIVDRLCALADIPRPRVVLVDQRQPNSWVVQFPRRAPTLFLTTGLRELLSPDELTAVIGHELAHIVNRDALVMTVVGMPSTIMTNARGGGFGAVFVLLIGAISQLGTATLSRYREHAADAGSAAITGRPSALAAALLKVSDELERIPSKDLRAAAALNSFNLVAVTSRPRRRGRGVSVVVLRNPQIRRAFATHPPLQARLDLLHALERDQQRG